MGIWESFRRFSTGQGERRRGSQKGAKKQRGSESPFLRPRNLQLERFEDRVLLAITGPKLAVVIPNASDILNEGEVLSIAPRELLLRFAEGQTIDPSAANLSQIQVVRAGGDGTFGNGNDVVVDIGWAGRNDAAGAANEVTVRFASTLPDDQYQIIVGTGFKNLAGQVYDDTDTSGVDTQTLKFRLDLGAQVTAVVPQPITRTNGVLSQAYNVIEVYFNQDQLKTWQGHTGELNPEFFQLILTGETATTNDDVWVTPSQVTYGYDTAAGVYKATLLFNGDVTLHKAADGSTTTLPAVTDLAQIGTGAFRLRIGNSYVDQQFTTRRITAAEGGTSFYTAENLSAQQVFPNNNAFGQGSGSQSLIISAEIDKLHYNLEWPGALDEPGQRDLPNQPDTLENEDHASSADQVDGIPVRTYYFPDFYGFDSVTGAPLRSAITPAQKQRTREIFEIYGKYLGVTFQEVAGDQRGGSFAIVTGDIKAIDDTYPNGPDGPGGIAGGGTALMNYTVDWGDSEFGGAWFQTALHEIGHLLNLKHSYDLPAFTVMGSSEDATTATGSFEPVFPGDYDIVHGQRMWRPDSTDIDLYKFTLDQAGMFSAEIMAERLGVSSTLDAQVTLYEQYTTTETVTVLEGGVETQKSFSVTRYRVIARNDNYYSDDAYLEMYLKQGTYFVGVSASGNNQYDPNIDSSGIGGVSDGVYELRVNFNPGGVNPDDPNTFKGDGTTHLTDTNQTFFDGDADGVPGGVYDYWFNVQKHEAVPSAPGRTEATTIYVDKLASAAGANGTIARPYNEIDRALAVARPGDIVRIVGNNFGNDTGALANLTDNRPYEIGRDSSNIALADGAKLEVPKGVTVLFDAGAMVKLSKANIDVGSSSMNLDRSLGSLQVLGIPGRPVYFTSFYDQTLGVDGEAGRETIGEAGDWGGLVFRNQADYDFIAAYDPKNAATTPPRTVLETQGIFLNYVNHADIRYGGGKVSVNGVESVYDPIHMVEARPTITYNKITHSADAALSGDPNSFADTKFENWDIANPFTTDYERIGPFVRNNTLMENSINGMYIRVTTPAGQSTLELDVAARWDDWDVVHVVSQNLFINGTPGGAYMPEATTILKLTDSHTIQAVAASTTGFDDGQYFSLFDGATEIAFEFDRPLGQVGYGVTAGRERIEFLASDTAATIAGKVADKIHELYVAKRLKIDAEVQGDTVTLLTDGPTLRAEGFGAPEARLDARLKVDPGLIVKLGGSRIETEMGAQLIAEGRKGSTDGAQGYKVVFTSIYDNRYGAGGDFDTIEETSAKQAAAGDWGGLNFGPVSEASIDQAVIAYAGGIVAIEGGFAQFNPVEIRQATARIANTRFEYNGAGSAGDRNGRGFITPATIYVRGAQPVIAGNDFLNNSGHVISVDVNSLKATTVPDWGRTTGALDAFDAYTDNHGPLVRENRITGNLTTGINGMEVRGGTLTTESIWDDTDIVHLLYTEVIVPNFQHIGGLRLQSSAEESLVIKLQGANAGFTADGMPYENDNRIGGSVQIVGTAGHPVVLTSLSDDSVGAGFDLRDRPQFDTNNNGASIGTPSSWRSVKLTQYSNDRNVAVINEQELASGLGVTSSGQIVDPNAMPQSAEALGQLAPSEKAGDDNRRLGFEVHGNIRFDATADVDVYSFSATAGTEVWIDLDWSTFALDAVVELIDAEGNVLARSDNSVDEQATDDPYGVSPHLYPADPDSVPLVRTMDRDPWGQPNGGTTYTSDTADQYTMNPRDAGMRVVLPGDGANVQTYYVRVRSELAIGDLTEANVGDRFQVTDGAGTTVQFEFTNNPDFSSPDYVRVLIPANPTEEQIADALVTAINNSGLADVTARKLFSGDVALDGVHLKFNPLSSGLAALANTSGKYQLQVRLRETQEIAGSTVRYADIRYATSGIEVIGLPAHSPLQGEIAENNSVSNNLFGNAQDVGNLLQSDEGTISVAGYLSNNTDIDWYRMGLDLEGIQSIGGVNDRGGIWATIFDIDYADGLAGADLAMFVFDASGRLLFTSDSSNIADDRPEPIPGATIADLSRGSVGAGDPYIGTAFLSEGNDTNYYIAITSTLNVPSELLDSSPYTRREPLNSVNRVATEHFAPTDPDTGAPIYDRPYNFPNYDANDPANKEFLGQRLTPIVNEFNLGDVIMYVNTGSDLYTVNPFSGQFETDVTPFPGGYLPSWSGTNYYNDIAMSNDGRLMTLTAGSRSAGGVQDPNCVRLDTGDARTAVSTQSTGITVYRLVNNGLVEDPGNEIEFEALAHDPRTIGAVGTTTNGSRVRTMLAVGSATETGVVQYGHNLVYLLDQNGNGINHPSIVSGAVAGGARVTSDIVPVGQFYTSPTIIATDATQTHGPYSNPQLNYQQADMLAGESFTINDDHWVATFSSSATVASLNNDVFSVGGRTFAFDDLAVTGSPTGSQVLVTINSGTGGDTIATVAAKLAAAINSETNAEATPYTDPGTGNVEVHIGGTIRSGQEPRFSGGTPAEMSVQYRTGAPFVFELDFGVEVLTPAATPSVLRDGQTFTLQATTGEVYQFEFDSGRVLQVNNRNLLEGDRITVNAGGVDHTFVFDDQNVVGTPAAADYTIVVDSSWMTTAQVADAVAREISRDLAGHAVSATAVGSRISLMGETMVSYNDLEGSTAEIAVQGEYGLDDPSKTAVNFEESMVGAEFAAAFEAVVNSTGTIEASYAYRAPGANGSNPGDRISFSGLLPVGVAGSQTSFAGTPNWTYQTGTADGAATAGRIPIALKATDNATEVAAKIAAALNDPAIPLFVNAAASGGNVELTQIKASSVTGLVGSASAVTAPSLNFEGDGPGGNVTGLAYLPDPAYPNNPDMSRLYAVTDTGGLYEVTGWQSGWGFTPVNPQGSYNYIRRNIGQGPQLNFITNLTYDTQQLAFSGLTAGPQNVENAKYSQMLFATDESGHLYAMDTSGNLQPIFSNSAERVQLTVDMDDNSLTDVRGVTFSPIDYNLWHMTDNRWADQGHGVLATPDATRNSNFFPSVSPVPGDYSMYFGLEDPGRGTVVNQDLLTGQYKDVQPGSWNFDTTRNSSVGDNEAYGTYNLPGGAHGTFTTNTFSLQGYSSLDKPVLYFNYFADTENTLDYDGARVYVSNDGAHWDLIATNTDTDDGTMNAFQRGIEQEMQIPVQPDRIIDEIVDDGVWRQARVDLSKYAGQSNLRLRFDFSTASDMGIGDDHRYLTPVPADWLTDGEYFMIDTQRFEFDLGYALQLPNTAGATISDGEWFQIDDGVGHVVRFEFDKDGSVTETDTLRRITIADTDNTAKVAQTILEAIQDAKNNPAYSLDIDTFLDDALDQGAFGAQVGIRIFLTRAVNVTNGVSNPADPGADVKILGNRPGTITSGIRVPLTGDMTREEVAEVITQVVNQRFRRQADINDNSTATGRINNLTDPDRIQAIAPSPSLNGRTFTVRAVTQRGEYREVTFTFRAGLPGVNVANETSVDVGLSGVNTADELATVIAEAITAAAKGLPELNITATAAADIVTLTGPVSFFGGGTSGLALLNYNGPIIKLDTQDGCLMNLLGHTSSYYGKLGYSGDLARNNPVSIAQSLRGDHPEWKDYTPSDSRPNDRYHLFERGQDNQHEGFYIDDIIIGFAERGEMVTGADAGGSNTSFQTFPRTPDLDNGEKPVITTGSYQLEVRTGTTYGNYGDAGGYPTTTITQTFDTNDRLAEGYTLEVPPASQIYHGQAFELYDGLNRLTFVFLDDVLRGGAGDGNVAIYFNSTQDGGKLSGLVADAINAAQQAGKINITARYLPGSSYLQSVGCNLVDLSGAVGFRNVHLPGVTDAIDVDPEYYSVKGFDGGDRNLERLKGQIILETNQIKHSGEYGIYVAPARDGDWKDLDPQTPHPGSGRSLNTPNNLVPGILIENNLVAFTGTGLSFGGTGADNPGTGIYFSGSTGQPTGAIPFGRIVNNTVYGLLGNPLGTGIEVLNNASPTVINNIVANVESGIFVDNSSRTAGTIVGYNLYQNVDDRAVGSYANSEWVVPGNAPLFVNPALENFYLAPGEDINGNKVLDSEDQNGNGVLDAGEDLNGNGVLDFEDLNHNLAIDYNWAIDSSLESLDERSAYFNSVLNPIGIPKSPILAPDRDLFGQLRKDDRSSPDAGAGLSVKLDRGAIDRVDFEGLRAVLDDPNDADGDGRVVLVGVTPALFKIRLLDNGIGVDDRTVTSDMVKVYLDGEYVDGVYTGTLLTDGNQYFFEYNQTNDEIYLRPTTGVWTTEHKYWIALDNNKNLRLDASPAITDLAGNLLQPNQPDDTTQFMINLAGLDFGDAPARYPVLKGQGAEHAIGDNYLGLLPPLSRTEATPSANADSDTQDDGVDFTKYQFVAGGTTTIDVTATVTGATAGYLHAWIDYNNNGVWEESYVNPGTGETISEHVIVGRRWDPLDPIAAETKSITISIPDGVASGTVAARLRFSSEASLSPTGLAMDGEVEDYMVTIVEFLQDFGDAPTTIGTTDTRYATTGANAARHRLQLDPDQGLHLGSHVDSESNGQPNAAATGDDGVGLLGANGTINDEDGLTNLSSLALVHGQQGTFEVQVFIPSSVSTAYLQGWIDFNNDGDWEDSWDENGETIREQIFLNYEFVNSGTYTLPSFKIPQAALKQQTYARLRLSSTPGLGPTGIAAGDVVPDGEVEDYRVSIIAAQEDFGDAPGSQTARSDNGARHTILTGFHLGSQVDFENDGTPSAGANWDDTHDVDDEDGVTFGQLRTGYTSTITVTAEIPATIAHAYLNAWLDFNNDGDFDDSGEKLVFLPRDGVSNPFELTNGANTLSFNVPETLPDGQLITTRNVAARFRLSDTSDLGPTTPAAAEQGPVGEVEDYLVQVLAGESSISGHAFLDLNGDGEWQDSPDDVGSMAVPTPQRQGAGAGQRVLSGTDDYTWLQFGFGFDYFGSRYTGCYINANGTISFGPPVTSGMPADSNVPMIAPFWSDVDMTSVGSVSVQSGTSSRGNLFVQIDWFGVGRTVDNRTNTFSLYLENDPNGDIVAFFYDTMSWAAPTDDGTTASWIGFDPGVGESFVTFPQPANLNDLRSAGSVPTYAFRTDPTTGKLVGQESGLKNFTIYLDMDNSGNYTLADKVTTTDDNGYYEFTGLFPGDTYLVGEKSPEDPNWQQTPHKVGETYSYTYTHTFPPSTNEQITGYNFGNRHISQLSVQDVVVTEGNSGTTQVEVTLELTDTYGGPVTVNYSTQNGTAQANQDYPSASGTFTIPAHGVPAPVWTKQTLTEDAGNDFSYQIVGNLVLWEGYDGHDRELFLYDGAVVHQLTSNAVDDRYATIVPGTGGAWTVYWSQFDGNDYEILAKHYSGTGAPEAVQDVALTNNTFDDKSPQASDTFVTWLGTTTNGSELFVAKVGDTTVWQLTRNSRPDYEPQISGECIVWSGGTGNNQEIYLWDGSLWTNTATDPSSYIQPLTNNATVDQWPKIDGSLVVWEGFDGQDSEIYMYQIGGSLAPVKVTDDTDGTADTQPQVSDNMIVWTRTSGGPSNSEIAYYDANNWYGDPTNQIPFYWYNLLTYNSVADEAPRIQNGHVVWHRQVGSSPVNYDVFYRDLTTGSIETNISNGPAYDWYPQVSDEYVVWRNYNGTDYEIVIAHQTQPTVKAKLTLLINGDTTIESDESFFVNFTSAVGANLIDAQAQVTILNDDGQMDYGDAPSSYPTLLGQNGARHVITTGMSLGSRVDSETNGQPSAQATGDDTQQYDDEDGVVFNTSLASGNMAQITVTAALPTGVQKGYLDAWIDFNGDGRWTDNEKLVFNNYTGLQAGTNVLTFSVPTTAKAGTVAARFRLSSTGGLAPTGTALDGEVEDYMVAIAKGTSLVINNRTLTVTGTDLDDIFSVTTGATVEVTLNGETTQFNAASLDRIVFDGKGGRNQATVLGTTADETIVASPGSASLTRTGLEVLLSNSQVISIDGNGGDDTATITGTAADESALAGPQWATLTSGTDRVAVSHVPTVVIDGMGGSDVISMLDSSDDDTVDAKSGTFTMTDAVASYSIEAKNFEAGTAYARAGGNDKAYLHGTTENDHYFGGPESGMLLASSFRYRANGFDQLFVYGNGGQDGATLEGSEYNDTFEAHPQDGWASLSGPNYSHRLWDFQSIDVYGSRGDDTALLYGKSDPGSVNTFMGTPAQAVLATQGFSARVNHFNSVQAIAQGGTNLAYLFGSLGNDYFTGSNAQSRLYGAGFELIAQGFDRVLASGAGGYDEAVLEGSSGSDHLRASKRQATVELGLSDLITVDDFDWVEAKDTDTPDNNTTSVHDEATDFVLKSDEWLEP